jgi:hypothetical protein
LEASTSSFGLILPVVALNCATVASLPLYSPAGLLTNPVIRTSPPIGKAIPSEWYHLRRPAGLGSVTSAEVEPL